jgi:hypothetical protein
MADRLKGLCTKYATSYALYLALKDYLGYLEKYEGAIDEEQHMPIPSVERLIQQWKAERAARDLPAMMRLMHLFVEYTPLVEYHILSHDGNRLVPLLGEDKHRSVIGRFSIENRRP